MSSIPCDTCKLPARHISTTNRRPTRIAPSLDGRYAIFSMTEQYYCPNRHWTKMDVWKTEELDANSLVFLKEMSHA